MGERAARPFCYHGTSLTVPCLLGCLCFPQPPFPVCCPLSRSCSKASRRNRRRPWPSYRQFFYGRPCSGLPASWPSPSCLRRSLPQWCPAPRQLPHRSLIGDVCIRARRNVMDSCVEGGVLLGHLVGHILERPEIGITRRARFRLHLVEATRG